MLYHSYNVTLYQMFNKDYHIFIMLRHGNSKSTKSITRTNKGTGYMRKQKYTRCAQNCKLPIDHTDSKIQD